MISLRYSHDRVLGMLLGTFIGDAIGSLFENRQPDEIPILDLQFIHEHPPIQYTDDMQMTISVFEEMAEHGQINPISLKNRILERFSPWRKYGGGMLEVIGKWRGGENIETAAAALYNGQGSFGNGAAMRSAPISAFYGYEQITTMINQVRKASSLTHAHPYGIEGAVLQSYTVLLAFNDIPPEEWLSFFFSFPIESSYKIKLEKASRCLEKYATQNEVVREIGNGSHALESVPAAIYSVIRNQDNFLDSLLFAVSLGGDSDTIGAMTGAIAGARFGLTGIPEECLKSLENGEEGREFVINLVKKLPVESGN